MIQVLSDLHDRRKQILADGGIGGAEMSIDDVGSGSAGQQQRELDLMPLGSAWFEDGLVRDVFIQHLLVLGSKSFSHLLNVLER